MSCKTQVLMKLDGPLLSLKSMSNEMKRIGRMLIANEQGRNFTCLNVKPQQPGILELWLSMLQLCSPLKREWEFYCLSLTYFKVQPCLWHNIIVFMHVVKLTFQLKSAYLPTMPDDSLSQAGGRFYRTYVYMNYLLHKL